jgi:hypothetical protein
VTQWKKQLLENMPEAFSRQRRAEDEGKRRQKKEDRLYRKIGQLEVERDFLKKKSEELGILPADYPFDD